MTCCCVKCRREFSGRGGYLPAHFRACDGNPSPGAAHQRASRRYVENDRGRHNAKGKAWRLAHTEQCKVIGAKAKKRYIAELPLAYVRELLQRDGFAGSQMDAELIAAKREAILNLRAIREVRDVIRQVGKDAV